MTDHASEPDLLRRTARRLALQTALVFILAIAGLAAGAGWLITHTQSTDAARLVHQVGHDADAVTDAPGGVLVYRETDGRVESSPQLAGAPIDLAALEAVRHGGAARNTEVHRGGREYLVRTERVGPSIVQVALDRFADHQQRERLMEALFAAAAAGTVLALGYGWLVGRRAIAPLSAAMQRQRQFVADASHELRTPLTQIHTRAQLLRRSLADQPELAAEADRLVAGTRLMGDIVEDLLSAAQLESDQPARQPVDLAAIARAAVDAEMPRAQSQLVDLEVTVDAGPHVINGSATALRRVLNSLLDNALGHTQSGDEVSVTVRRDHNEVWLSVADTGSGFDPANGDQLFQRFARGQHGTGRRYGLGLALAQQVVQAHGGRIEAAGAVGAGASFTIVVPARSPADPASN